MKGLIGGILMAIGILIGGASGLCTLLVLGSSLAMPSEWAGIRGSEMIGSLMMVLIIGGVPFLAGVGLFFLGRRIMRAERTAAGLPADVEATAAAKPAPTDQKED